MLRPHIGVMLTKTDKVSECWEDLCPCTESPFPTNQRAPGSPNHPDEKLKSNTKDKSYCASKQNCTCTPTSNIQRSVPIIKY